MANYLDINGLSYYNNKLQDKVAQDIQTKFNQIKYYTTASATANEFTVSIPYVTTLYDGLVVHCKFNAATASGATLNVSGTGGKPIYYRTATAATTHISPANNYVTLIYDGTNDHWVMQYNYDANTNTIGYQLRTNSAPFTNKTGYSMNRYTLLFEVSGGLSGCATTIGTGTSKTTVAPHYIPGGVIKYYSTSGAIANNGSFTAAGLWDQYTLDLRYTFNIGTNVTTLVNGAAVYVRMILNNDGTLSPDYQGTPSHPVVTTLPSTADGKYYVYLGRAYGTNKYNIELTPYHPIYEYRNGQIRLWSNPDSYTKSEINNLLAHSGNAYVIHASSSVNPAFNSTATQIEPNGDAFTTVDGVTVSIIDDLHIGDTIYILEENVPDRWYIGAGAFFALESKTDLSGYALSSSLATVATSGSYNDLSNKPTIPDYYDCPFLSGIMLQGSGTVQLTTEQFNTLNTHNYIKVTTDEDPEFRTYYFNKAQYYIDESDNNSANLTFISTSTDVDALPLSFCSIYVVYDDSNNCYTAGLTLEDILVSSSLSGTQKEIGPVLSYNSIKNTPISTVFSNTFGSSATTGVFFLNNNNSNYYFCTVNRSGSSYNVIMRRLNGDPVKYDATLTSSKNFSYCFDHTSVNPTATLTEYATKNMTWTEESGNMGDYYNMNAPTGDYSIQIGEAGFTVDELTPGESDAANLFTVDVDGAWYGGEELATLSRVSSIISSDIKTNKNTVRIFTTTDYALSKTLKELYDGAFGSSTSGKQMCFYQKAADDIYLLIIYRSTSSASNYTFSFKKVGLESEITEYKSTSIARTTTLTTCFNNTYKVTQPTYLSSSGIKTINSQSLVGSGNISASVIYDELGFKGTIGTLMSVPQMLFNDPTSSFQIGRYFIVIWLEGAAYKSAMTSPIFDTSDLANDGYSLTFKTYSEAHEYTFRIYYDENADHIMLECQNTTDNKSTINRITIWKI